jgi:hypothetical protein
MILIDLLGYLAITLVTLRQVSMSDRLSQLKVALHQLLTQRPELFDHLRVRGMRCGIAHLTIM